MHILGIKGTVAREHISPKRKHSLNMKSLPVNILGGLVGIGAGEVQQRASDALIEAAANVFVETAQERGSEKGAYRGERLRERTRAAVF
jgi:hypothetical protein